MLFLKMSYLKIKQKDIHKIFSYISTLYESSTGIYIYIYIYIDIYIYIYIKIYTNATNRKDSKNTFL